MAEVYFSHDCLSRPFTNSVFIVIVSNSYRHCITFEAETAWLYKLTNEINISLNIKLSTCQ